MAGAGRFAREAATVLQREGFRVVLVDTRYAHVQQARSAGLSACYASILSEHLLDTVDFSDLGRFLALTSSDELNTLAAATFSDVFGRQHVYQLTPAPAEIELTINNERHDGTQIR